MKARDNPFCTDRVLRARYRPQGTTWHALLARLEALHHRAALVGPEGSGKTTLLEELMPRLRERGFGIVTLRLDHEHRAFPPGLLPRLYASLSDREIILFDGAEQMSRLAWHRFKQRTRRAAGLIITTHRPGLLPTLLHCATTPQLLRELVAEIAPGEEPRLRAMLPHLFVKHDGNLRDALRELYDVYADGGEKMRGQPVC